MEIELINKSEQINKDYYKLDFNGQNVEKLPSFKKWYENRLKEIKLENERRSKIDEWANNFDRTTDLRILCIFYCRNCTSYVTCSYKNDFSCVECNKCKTVFCPGCNYIKSKENQYYDESTCLKGYWKLWWLRAKNCRSDLVASCLLFYIMHVIFCIFFTPLYLGFISFYIGFFSHPKIYSEKFRERFCPVLIYSILFGLIWFPYIIILVPLMILLLIPGIFNHDYYINIFIAYVTTLMPGHSVLSTFYLSEKY